MMVRKIKTGNDTGAVFTPELDKTIKRGGAAITKILKNDPAGRSVRDLIEYHLQEIDDGTRDDLAMALALAFDEAVEQTIAFPLFTNDPMVLAEYERIGLPERVLTFLRYLVSLYGARAEDAVICLEQPDGLKQTYFTTNYDETGTPRSITMKLTRADNDSISITDEPDSYLFLVYQMLERLAGIELPDAPDRSVRDALESIGGKVDGRIRDGARDIIKDSIREPTS
jgi:hypothetical protein